MRERATARSGRRRTGVIAFAMFAIVIAVVALSAHRPSSISDRLHPSPVTVATVTTDVLNVRDRPALDANVIGALPEGAGVTITGAVSNGFLPVQYGAETGWMSEQYLRVDAGTRAGINQPNVGVPAVSAAEPETPGEGEQDELATTGTDVNLEVSQLEVVPSGDDPLTDMAAETSIAGEVAPAEGVVADETETDVVVANESQVVADVNDDSAGEHWIEVDRPNHLVKLHVGDRIVGTFSARLGRDPSVDGFYSTAVGTYHVFSMSDDLSSTPFADGVYLDNWVGFDLDRKNGFHSPVLGSDGVENPHQNPTTLGCVRMDAGSAEAVYAFAYIGMRVMIHD